MAQILACPYLRFLYTLSLLILVTVDLIILSELTLADKTFKADKLKQDPHG